MDKNNAHSYLIESEEFLEIRSYPLQRCVFIARQNDKITNKILKSLVNNFEDVTLVETT